MDPRTALSALVWLVVGAALGAFALWCRAGRSPRARFWVRRESLDQPGPFPYGETAVLVALPLLSQTLVVTGVLVGGFAVDALRPAVSGWLAPAAVIAEVGLWLVVLLATGYRTIMPLWVYPAWLRRTRSEERAILRERRRQVQRGAA